MGGGRKDGLDVRKKSRKTPRTLACANELANKGEIKNVIKLFPRFQIF